MPRYLYRNFLAVAAIALPGFAFAADVAPRAYTKAPAYSPSYDWSGFYVGASVGGRWSEVTWNTQTFSGIAPLAASNPQQLDSSSVRVGGIVGYNWQVSPAWVVGLEGDIAWADSKKTISGFPGSINFFVAANHDTVGVKLGWDASIRARLGYLVTPATLVYATGGVAFQEITTTATCDGTALSFCGAAFPSNLSNTTVKTGWTVGGGIETVISQNWFARAEYRYSDFGNVTHVLPPVPAVGFTANIDVKTHTALVGLTYKFGGPVVAKY